MALIICKECGKKVSDTCTKCIHCGTPILEGSDDIQKKSVAEKMQSTVSDDQKTLMNFDRLENDDRTILEREFLKCDSWARKYRRTKAEIPSFGFAIIWCICVLYIIFKTVFTFELFPIGDVINPMFERISLISFIALGVLLVGMHIYSIFARIYLKISLGRYVYMKKFQKWLKEYKDIEYTPPIIKIKEKRIFDSIDIDKY